MAATTDISRLGWFHRYPARLHWTVLAQMSDGMRERLGVNPQLLLDPFAGSGAVMAGARMAGWPSIGIEYTQLGCLVASVRLEPPEDPEAGVAFIDAALDRKPSHQSVRFESEILSWIGAENATTLATVINATEQESDPRLRNWLRLCISSSLRPASRWLPGSIKPQVDPNREPSNIAPHLRRAALKLARDTRREPRSGISADVVRGSSTSLPIGPETVDAVITSPPYGWMYDYVDVHRLSYLAFGWSVSRDRLIGRRFGIQPDGYKFVPPEALSTWYGEEFRGELTVEGRALRSYVQEMRAVFSECARVLRPGGVVALAIANSYRRGAEFDLTGGVVELLEEAGLKEVEVENRDVTHERILPAGRDPKTGRFSSGEAALPAVQEKLVYAKKQDDEHLRD